MKVADLNASARRRKPGVAAEAVMAGFQWIAHWERVLADRRRRARVSRFNDSIKRDLDHGRS